MQQHLFPFLQGVRKQIADEATQKEFSAKSVVCKDGQKGKKQNQPDV